MTFLMNIRDICEWLSQWLRYPGMYICLWFPAVSAMRYCRRSPTYTVVQWVYHYTPSRAQRDIIGYQLRIIRRCFMSVSSLGLRQKVRRLSCVLISDGYLFPHAQHNRGNGVVRHLGALFMVDVRECVTLLRKETVTRAISFASTMYFRTLRGALMDNSKDGWLPRH